MSFAHAALLCLPLLAAAEETAPPAAVPPAPATSAPAAGPVSAAAPAVLPPGRVGVGVAIGPGEEFPALYLSVDAGALRTELEAAYREDTAGGDRVVAARAGLGLFGLLDTSTGARCALGGRVQWVRWDAAAPSQGLRVAGVVGAEWSPAPALALGVEGQLGYTIAGDHLFRSGGAGADRGLDVTAQAFLRVFLAGFERTAPAHAAPRDPPPAPPRRCRRMTDCEGPDVCVDGVCQR